MKAPVLSYIIPVYNGRKSIDFCLDSIYSLPLQEEDFEVVVIDDCSTDDTLQVLKNYASKHTNMVVLQQEVNQRQGAARNRGIDVAKGEYIAFCDADDYIVADGVMNALNAVSESKADICYFDFEYELPAGEWHLFRMPSETCDAVMSSTHYLEKYYSCYYNAPWRCLYRADFLREINIRFVEGVRWEDCDWTVKVYSKARSIQFVKGVGYDYVYNFGSTCRQNSPDAVAEQLYAGLRLLNFSDEITHSLPHLSKTLKEEACGRYVVGLLRFKNLKRYSLRQIVNIYKKLGQEKRIALSAFHFGNWEDFVLHHKWLTLFVMAFVLPLVRVLHLIKYNSWEL